MVKLSDKLYIEKDISNDAINSALIEDLKKAVDNIQGIKSVTITSAKSDHATKTTTGNVSRHSMGNAVDIAKINNIAVSAPQSKRLGDLVVDALVKLGYKHSASESGNEKCVIWQSARHYDHIHVSNTTGTASKLTAVADTPEDETQNQVGQLTFKRDPYFDKFFNKKGTTTESINEDTIFGTGETRKKNVFNVPKNKNRVLYFPFDKGKVLDVKDNGGKYDISILVGKGGDTTIFNYYGLKSTTLKGGNTIYKSKEIGVVSDDVKIEVLDYKSRPKNDWDPNKKTPEKKKNTFNLFGLAKDDVFGVGETRRKNRVKIPKKNNPVLYFPFEKGSVLDVNQTNGKYNVSISVGKGKEQTIFKYYGLNSTSLRQGTLLYKTKEIGTVSDDVEVEILNHMLKPKNDWKYEPDKQSKDNSGGISKNKNKKSDLIRYGSPTSKDQVTQGWIFKQIGNYFKSKK